MLLSFRPKDRSLNAHRRVTVEEMLFRERGAADIALGERTV
jgi:hypothetical protein